MSITSRRRIVTVVVVLVAMAGLSTPHAGKIYWSGIEGQQSVMFRANLNGSDIEIVIADFTVGLAIDPVARKMYFAGWDSVSETTTLRRANLNGTNVQVLCDIGWSTLKSLALHPETGWIFMSSRDGEGTCDGIHRCRMSGGDSPQSIVADICVDGLAVDDAAGKLYWAEYYPTKAIRRANVDGSDPEIAIDLEHAYPPASLALDSARGKLYWSTDAGPYDGILRGNIDGSNVETVIPGGDYPQGIALDLWNDNLYWVKSYYPGAIKRSDLDGSSTYTILDAYTPSQIAIDPVPDGADVPALSLRALVVLVLVMLVLSAVMIRKREATRQN